MFGEGLEKLSMFPDYRATHFLAMKKEDGVSGVAGSGLSDVFFDLC